MFNDCLKLCRPAHTVKNLLILLPPFFGQRILQKEMILSSLLAFCSFSLVASVVYVFNDLADKEKDSVHPKKCHRPIASGKVSVKAAWGLILILFVCGVGTSLGAADKVICLILLAIYLLSNIAYSAFLKNYPVVDIFILASGFVLRVYYGGAWFGVVISPWLFLCIFCGALWFATGKRRNELLYAESSGKTRPVLKKIYDWIFKQFLLPSLRGFHCFLFALGDSWAQNKLRFAIFHPCGYFHLVSL